MLSARTEEVVMDDGADLAAGARPVARVETVPLNAVPPAYRRDAVGLTLHRRIDGATAAHYLSDPADRLPGRDLVAVVSLGSLDSPDQLEVEEVRLDGQLLILRLRVRRFEGRLAANVRRLGLVIVELGDVAPGRYQAEVSVDHYVFSQYERPASATFDRSTSHELQFEVAGG
jgi:hypothetical protein